MFSSSLITYVVLLFACTARCSDTLVAQQNVPVILFSHRLSPGLLRYQENYEPRSTIPVDSFNIIAKELLDFCNSDAYIFINVPGLRKLDFIQYGDEMPFFQRYLNTSSTKLKFEQVKSLPSETYTDLISYTKNKCQFEGHIHLSGNNSDDFAAYIDTGKRVIEINYVPLPIEPSARNESISHFDKYLREILAQIPSPHHTIFLTSLEPQLVPEEDRETLEIFPELFKDVRDVEKNNMKLNVAPIVHKYSPKFPVLDDVQVSIFDNDFIAANKGLLSSIIAVSFGCLVWLIVLQLQTPKSKKTKKVASNPPASSEIETREGEEVDNTKDVDEVEVGFAKHTEEGDIASVNRRHVSNPTGEK